MVELPARIVTDMGETVVRYIPPSAATKIHKCTICRYETDFYEEQYLLFPVAAVNRRRYVHCNCLVKALECEMPIRLAPNANMAIITDL